ncbi:MAG: hypothetical protein NTZ05_17775 [Chloroflexi bacterium]|nr:hypothetical protein [Chloroflexota bacterium]
MVTYEFDTFKELMESAQDAERLNLDYNIQRRVTDTGGAPRILFTLELLELTHYGVADEI